jgi:hypothetical protein
VNANFGAVATPDSKTAVPPATVVSATVLPATMVSATEAQPTNASAIFARAYPAAKRHALKEVMFPVYKCPASSVGRCSEQTKTRKIQLLQPASTIEREGAADGNKSMEQKLSSALANLQHPKERGGPWVYIFGESTTRLWVESVISQESAKNLDHVAGMSVRLNRRYQQHQSKLDYSQRPEPPKGPSYGKNEGITDFFLPLAAPRSFKDINGTDGGVIYSADTPSPTDKLSSKKGVAHITFEWNPWPNMTRFRWVMENKFAPGRPSDLPDAVIISGLGMHSCAWEVEKIEAHINDLKSMFISLQSANLSVPVIFVGPRNVTRHCNFHFQPDNLKLNNCIQEFRNAWRKMAQKSNLPWIDLAPAGKIYEDMFDTTHRDGVHMLGAPGTELLKVKVPFNGAVMDAVLLEVAEEQR